MYAVISFYKLNIENYYEFIYLLFSQVSQYEEQLSAASLVCVDGNIPVSTINYICSIGKKHSVPGKVT